MDTDYFSYSKKGTEPIQDRDPLWLMEEEKKENMEYREPTMIQWGMVEENNKPSPYTNNKMVASTEPLLIPNSGTQGIHKPNNNHKRMAYTFPNTINNNKFDEWTKEEKRRSQPTFLFTVGSLQKEEGPVPWPAKLVSKSHEKQRRRHHRSNGYNKSTYDEQEDMIFTMEDA